MGKIDLAKINNVHFIGIGGIGISAIARMMKKMGKNVSGQDMQGGEIVDLLKKIGIDIIIGQSFENIPKDCELIVYTIAIENYDPELFDKIKSPPSHEATEGLDKIFIKSYPEMLGTISADKYTIAVSGTHGKTTTTGMLAKIFKDTGKDPSVVIGSLITDNEGNKTNFIFGESEYFIIEACEYRRSFLNINPKILVITNIDEDHLDYYKDIEDIKNAFREMATKVPADGFVICDPNDKNISDVIENIKATVIDYTEYLDQNISLKIPGQHNKRNSAKALAVARICNIGELDAKKALTEFSGTWRRFEYKGKLNNGTLVYDDYGHAPAEIRATMQGFRELYPSGMGWKITMVFQPHLFSRTKLLLNDFAKCFSEVDELLILPIYYAREEDDGSISSEILADRINQNTHNAKSFSDFESVEKYLENRISKMGEKDIIVTMGAGEAFKIGDYLLKKML